MDFNEEQQAAISGLKDFLRPDNAERWIGLYGFAGTGKSTVVMEAIKGFNGSVGLSAPTHKAVSVLKKLASRGELFEDADVNIVLRTIHSLLRLRKSYKDGRVLFLPDTTREPPVAYLNALVLDECSMASLDMLSILEQAQEYFDFKVIVMGDPYQLKPVDDGGKMSKSFDVPGYELTRIMRNGGIIGEAVAGIRDHLDDYRFSYAKPGKDEMGEVSHHFMSPDFFEHYMDVLGNRLDGSEHAKMLAYTNRRVDSLNAMVRERLFGADVDPFIKGEYMVSKQAYTVDDEIILYTEQIFQIKDARRAEHMGLDCWLIEFEDSGTTRRIMTLDESQMPAYDRELHTLKQNGLMNKRWRPYYRMLEAFAMIRPPYATTVHRSQGSTYEQCLVDEAEIKSCTHGDMDTRGRLLYVAYSRASKGLHILT